MGTFLRSEETSLRVVVCFFSLLLVVGGARATFGQNASTVTQAFNQNVKELYFPFNIYNRTTDSAALDANSAWLKQNTDKVWIQGYADPRGDIVYNLVLSYRRAQFVKAKLVKAGVDPSRIQYATGWGKLYQSCGAKDDTCFEQNRRVSIVPPEAMMFHWAGQ